MPGRLAPPHGPKGEGPTNAVALGAQMPRDQGAIGPLVARRMEHIVKASSVPRSERARLGRWLIARSEFLRVVAGPLLHRGGLRRHGASALLSRISQCLVPKGQRFARHFARARGGYPSLRPNTR